MGYQENEKGEVVITMTRDDWSNLLLALGFAAGAAHQNENLPFFRGLLALANRLNEGNPKFTPYGFDEKPERPADWPDAITERPRHCVCGHLRMEHEPDCVFCGCKNYVAST